MSRKTKYLLRKVRRKKERRIGKDRQHRASDLGLDMENRVKNVLELMIEEGLIDSFIRYPPNTPKKDFRVIRDGVVVEVNITISQRVSNEHHIGLAPEVKTVCLHPSLIHDGNAVEKKILQLFN